jgi:mannose/fructose/N-acetylgalactosamine-specific phosphotransferase system component IID
MEYIIVILAVVGAMYVGYAYGQQVIDEVNDVLERVRAVINCIKRCLGGN